MDDALRGAARILRSQPDLLPQFLHGLAEDRFCGNLTAAVLRVKEIFQMELEAKQAACQHDMIIHYGVYNEERCTKCGKSTWY